MSQPVSYSRGDLYEKYRESDPKLAEKFLGEQFPDSSLQVVGWSFLAATLVMSIISIGIVAGITNGFGPTSNPTFYSTALPTIGGALGLGAVTGLIMLAVYYSKERHILAEQLKVEDINAIACKVLVDPTKGLLNL